MEPLDEQRESNLEVTTDAGSGMLFSLLLVHML